MNNTKPIPTMNSLLRSIIIVVIGISTLSLFNSCDREDSEPIGPSIDLRTSATLGAYLTDTMGNTLYSFANDFDGLNNCTGGCVAMWPVYYAGDFIVQSRLAQGLDIADFGTVINAGGQKQTTYKKWPLYYFAPLTGSTNVRESPLETKGEGFGGIWHVAKPDYTIRLINAQLTGLDGKNYKNDYTEGTGKTLYFSTETGLSLYHFSRDSFNINKFTKADFTNNNVWPIYEKDKIVVPSTLDKSLFGSITVFGRKQLTYKGWPLYNFGADNNQRGSNKGVSMGFPGLWPVMVKDAAGAPKP